MVVTSIMHVHNIRASEDSVSVLVSIEIVDRYKLILSRWQRNRKIFRVLSEELVLSDLGIE